MTSALPRLTRLTFHGPLSAARADAVVRRLTANRPRTVLDIGCGWGELLLRILAAVPDATGTGVDVNAEDLARARRGAEERGLAHRVEFAEESALGTRRGPADLVLCLGATQALSQAEPATAEALRELRRLVSDDGRVLVGEGFWERPPTEAELSGMWPGAGAGDHYDLKTLSISPSPPVSGRSGPRPRAARSGRSSSRATRRTWRSGSPPTRTIRWRPRPGPAWTGTGPSG